MKRQLLGSSFFRVLENLVNLATALVLTPILIVALGTSQYGLWLLVLSVTFIFPLFELGFATSIQRAMAQAIERKDSAWIRQLFSTGLVLFAALSVPAVIMISVFALYPAWLGIGDEFAPLATIILLLLLLKVALDMLANAVHGIYSGHLRLDLDAKICIVQTLLRSALMIGLVSDYGILALVFATLLTDLLAHIARFVLAFKLQPGLLFGWHLVCWQGIKDLYQFGRHVFLLDVSRIIRSNSEPVVISHLLNLSAVSFYAVADRLVKQAEALTRSVLGSLQPFLIRKQHSGSLTDVAALHSLELSLFLHGVLLVCGVICGPVFIELWLGQGFAQSQALLPVLLFAVLFKAYSIPLNQLFIAHACHKKLVPLQLAGAITHIACMLLFGKLWGLFGVAWAAVLSNALIFTVALSVQANRILRLKWFAMVPGLLKLLLLFGTAYLFSLYVPVWRAEVGWLEFLLKAPVLVLATVILCYFTLLRAPLREVLYGSLQRH